MSYRSIKRVLGEASLEHKRLFLLGICLLTLITSGFWWYSSQTDELVLDATRRTAGGLTTTILFRQHLKTLSDEQGFEELYSQLGEVVPEEQYDWKLIRPIPSAAGAPLDRFEAAALAKLSRPDRERNWEENAGDPNYQYFQAIVAKDSCIHCHQSLPGQVDIKSGDLIAVMEVILPATRIRRAQTENRAILLANALVTVFISMVAVYFIMRYVVVTPLARSRDVSDDP